MKHRNLLFIFLFSSLLVGCATPEQRAARLRQEQAQREYEIRQVQMQRENKCASYGFTKGTTSYSNCLMQLDQAAATQKRHQEQINAAQEAAEKAAVNARCLSDPQFRNNSYGRCPMY